METSKWHMHRMGLIDFWYYLNEEFYFENGHILLRGSNGSGKSVTLQSIIPLLLDGNKSSERLDSFGTRARKMETYLLEEDSDRNDRIGYLYLEFKRENADVYKTIGMGLRARKNKPLDSWYFVIDDNRRINIDLSLMENNLAITKQMLKNLIGDQLIENQKDYMDQVNRSLFGFANRDEYKETVNLLVQLRTPKLSNSLKPTIINEILSNSLQPLSEEDLRPMTEAISNMDEIQDHLDSLKQSHMAAKNILNIFEQYNYASLDTKAVLVMEEEKRKAEIEKEILSLQEKNRKDVLAKNVALETKSSLQNEQETLNEELKELLNPDLIRLVEDYNKNKIEKDKKEEQLNKKKIQEEEKDSQYIDEKSQLHKYQDKMDEISYDIHQIFKSMDEIQKDIYFEEHEALKVGFLPHLNKKYDFEYTINVVKKEAEELKQGLNIFTQVEHEKIFINRILEEKEKKKQELEDVERSLKNLDQKLYQCVEEYKENFSQWNKNNSILCLSDSQMLNIFEWLQNFDRNTTYSFIEEIIQNEYLSKLTSISQKQMQIRFERNKLREKIRELEQNLQYWKKIKDPVPNHDEYVVSNREYLEKQQISFRPFYTLLEYQSDVSEEKKDILEEELSRMGILDALIVSKKDQEKVLNNPKGTADHYLFVEDDVENLEFYYFKEENNIEDMLQHFGWNESSIQINDRAYQYGIVTGTISQCVKNKFIGQQSREAYRLKKIQECMEQLDTIYAEDKEQEKRETQCTLDIEQLNKEKDSYPSKKEILSLHQKIENYIKNQSELILKIQALEEEKRNRDEQLKSYYLDISKIAEHLGIASKQEVFRIRKEYMEAYHQQIMSLQNLHIMFLAQKELYDASEHRVSDILEDLDLIRSEVIALTDDIKKISLLIDMQSKQMQEQGYDDVQKRIDDIQKRSYVIPIEISKQDQLIGEFSQDILRIEEDIIKAQESLRKQQEITDYNQKAYQKELELNYVSNEKMPAMKIHKFIIEKYPNLKNKDILGNDLQISFYQNRGYLQEYRLNIFNIFENEERNVRLDVNARYKGKIISFHYLVENLQKDIEQQSLLLEESDRNLIEDILVNTLSRKIRIHIQSSKRWVETMNRFMRSMNTSSGLNLSLKWQSHKAETEEELSSENLVKLLEKDLQILKESDRKSLSSHFRSKIQTARKMAMDESNKNGFHQIMKQVMDYRHWFDFQIWYEKTGERKKELTNNAFFTFSGGEKAMAMYVPLFSAVAAKYDQANSDAPMIIALDEAFAGVDEKNIDNMFALINKFKFDYIMNSQVLWGDYPSVPALAIYELYRPENAHFVTVISYKWNGKQKRMVNS